MYVTCAHCDMTVSSNTGFGSEKWNTRPIEDELHQTLTRIVEHGCVLHTEDGLCCYYCYAEVAYPDESGEYEHVELPHTTTCVWAKAKALLDANAPKEAAE